MSLILSPVTDKLEASVVQPVALQKQLLAANLSRSVSLTYCLTDLLSHCLMGREVTVIGAKVCKYGL